jgi:FixJ family two-component response regulator
VPSAWPWGAGGSRACIRVYGSGGKNVKVLFMSGYTDEAMGLHGVLAAGTRFIQKPFTADALIRKVREALDEP